jgi:hypothetical protein
VEATDPDDPADDPKMRQFALKDVTEVTYEP